MKLDDHSRGLSSDMGKKDATHSGLLRERYALQRLVGKGGMGIVYEVIDTFYGNHVAVKELCQDSFSHQARGQDIEMFRREAHLLSNLHHPNIPRMHDYFSEAGRYYYVMDFIEGRTLEAYWNILGKRQLPTRRILAIAMQLCSVLEYLHARPRPIIFRDLKPANIILTPRGKLYLIDFGIARYFKSWQANDTVVAGSPGYAAPEQFEKSQTTLRSDIYSLGVILYQLMTGDYPSWELCHALPLHLINQSFPADLSRLIMHMIDRNEWNRPAHISVVRREVERITLEWAMGR